MKSKEINPLGMRFHFPSTARPEKGTFRRRGYTHPRGDNHGCGGNDQLEETKTSSSGKNKAHIETEIVS